MTITRSLLSRVRLLVVPLLLVLVGLQHTPTVNASGRVSRYFVSHLVYSYSFDVFPEWKVDTVDDCPPWWQRWIGYGLRTTYKDAKKLVGPIMFAPTAFNYNNVTTPTTNNQLIGSGALSLGNGNSAIQLQDVFMTKSATFRLIFQLPTLPLPGSVSTLFDVANNDGQDNIKITVAGDLNNNQTAALLVHVLNGGRTCSVYGNPNFLASNAAPCGLMLRGFIRPGTWYDIVVTLDALGQVSVYQSGVLLSRANVFRHSHSRRYATTMIGASIYAIKGSPQDDDEEQEDDDFTIFDLFFPWISASRSSSSSSSSSKQRSKSIWPKDAPAKVILRAVQMFNTSFSDQAVRRWYLAEPGVGMAQMDRLRSQNRVAAGVSRVTISTSDSFAVDTYGSDALLSDPDLASRVDASSDLLWNVTGSALTSGDLWLDYETSSDVMDISSSTITLRQNTLASISFERNISDPLVIAASEEAAQQPTSTVPGPVKLHGDARWVKDVLECPLHNGILLSDSSAAQLSPLTIGGSFSLRMIFSPQIEFGSVLLVDDNNANIITNSTTGTSTSIQNSTLFWCGSAQSLWSREALLASVDSVSLMVSERIVFNTVDRVLRWNMSLVTFRLEIRRSTIVTALETTVDVRTTQTNNSLGWYDLIVTVDATGVASIYNHGRILGQGVVATPYPTVRDTCVLGSPNSAAPPPPPPPVVPVLVPSAPAVVKPTLSPTTKIGSTVKPSQSTPTPTVATPVPPSPPPTIRGLPMAVSLLEVVPFSLSDSVLLQYKEKPASFQRQPFPQDESWSTFLLSYHQPLLNNDDTIEANALRNGAKWEPDTPTDDHATDTRSSNNDDNKDKDTDTKESNSEPGSSSTSNNVGTEGLVPTSSALWDTSLSGSGSVLLSDGGYLNLGSINLGGEMTLQMQFTMLGSILQPGQAILELGNTFQASADPQDNILIATGRVDESGQNGDMVIRVYNNGAQRACNPGKPATLDMDHKSPLSSLSWQDDCSLVVPGALAIGRATSLVLIFRAGGIVEIFMDGILMLTSDKLWTPAHVVRPLCFVGNSYRERHLRKLNLPSSRPSLRLKSLSISTPAIQQANVQQIAPRQPGSFFFTFTDPSSINSGAVAAANAGLTSAAGSTGSICASGCSAPVLHGNAKWSDNPFDEDDSANDVDGTSVAAVKQSPTGGVYLANFNESFTVTALTPLEKKRDDAQYARDEDHKKLEKLNTDLGAQQQKCNPLQIKLDKTVAMMRNTLWNNNTVDQNITMFKNYDLDTKALDDCMDLIIDIQQRQHQIQQQHDIKEAQFRKFSDLYMQAQLSVYGSSNSSTIASSKSSYINLGSVYLGGEFTLRMKLSVRSPVMFENGTETVLKLSDESHQDGITVQVNGLHVGHNPYPRNKGLRSHTSDFQTISVTIQRGSLRRTLTSAPINSTKYWLDLVLTVNSQGRASLYNWGSLVSSGSLWTPIPGIRRSCWIGRSPSGDYLSNSAVALLHIQPSLMSKGDIQGLYKYDKPPMAIPEKAGPWHVTDVNNLNYFEWFIPGDDAVDINFSANNRHVLVGRNYQWLCEEVNEVCGGDKQSQVDGSWCTIGTDNLECRGRWVGSDAQDRHQKAVRDDIKSTKIALTFYNHTRDPKRLDFEQVNRFPIANALQELVKPYMRKSNLHDDKPYGTASPSSYIAEIVYYPPMLLHARTNDITLAMHGAPKYEPLILMDNLDKDEKKLFDLSSMGTYMYVVPPEIIFQYAASAGSQETVPPLAHTIPNADTAFNNDVLNGQKLAKALAAEKVQQTTSSSQPSTPSASGDSSSTPAVIAPFRFSLSADERIISVRSKCNYWFEFKTSSGRTLTIGDSLFMSKFPQCFTNILLTNDNWEAQTPSDAYQSDDPLVTSIDDMMVEEAPFGYSLQYMEKTRGGMYAWRWHWVRTPKSVEMYNLVFAYSASMALVGSSPSQAISIDLYNHGSLEQTVTATHTLSISEQISFTHDSSEDMNINWGGSVTVKIGQNTFAGFDAGVTVGGSKTVTDSNSYGNVTTTSYDDSQQLSAVVPAQSRITATMLVFKGSVDIPFTADVLVTHYNGETEHTITRGVYNHVKTTSIIVSYSAAKPIGDASPVE